MRMAHMQLDQDVPRSSHSHWHLRQSFVCTLSSIHMYEPVRRMPQRFWFWHDSIVYSQWVPKCCHQCRCDKCYHDTVGRRELDRWVHCSIWVDLWMIRAARLWWCKGYVYEHSHMWVCFWICWDCSILATSSWRWQWECKLEDDFPFVILFWNI